ncbi:MAG TPA: acyl-CoA dehydrogenase [Sphingomonas sp.]|uniref:acyl-CoA dehydrogenase family protein n=1 Tax=Sphingomonas sp. TaxID=28214 RepID=UPI002EDA1A28
MDFDLDDEQQMMRDLVVRLMTGRQDAAIRNRDRAAPEGFSAAHWRAMAELGLLALPFGQDVGGMGAGPAALITVMEELGRGLCSEPYLSDLILAGRLLERAGTAAQRDAWFPGIVAGEKRLVLAHVEPAARFNPLTVRCRAAHHGADVELDGVKTFVIAGVGADGFIVSTRDDGAGDDDADGISLWLVPADAPGIDLRSYRLVDGGVACELHLRGVTRAERLDGGADALLATFDEARVAACAELVGIMAMMFDATLDHIRTRKQFGQPIGSFQAIQHRMADCYVALEQSRSHLFRAALTVGADHPAAIAAAKSFVAAAAMKLGEECIQFHGGMGTSDELALGHGHKRIMLLAMLLGDSASERRRYLDLTRAEQGHA